MLEYHRTDISEGMDINKTNASKSMTFVIYVLYKNFRHDPFICNGCNDLIQKVKHFKNVAIFC